jgi:hypothetical protein
MASWLWKCLRGPEGDIREAEGHIGHLPPIICPLGSLLLGSFLFSKQKNRNDKEGKEEGCSGPEWKLPVDLRKTDIEKEL